MLLSDMESRGVGMWNRGQGRGDNKVKHCLELLRADLILAPRRARPPWFCPWELRLIAQLDESSPCCMHRTLTSASLSNGLGDCPRLVALLEA